MNFYEYLFYTFEFLVSINERIIKNT